MKRLNILPGEIFGNLTVIREDGYFFQPSGQHQRAFICKCRCGREKKIRISHLTSGRVSSCGCKSGEQHGMSKERLYNVWRGMKNRCHSKNYFQAYLYSGKGITVCDEWRYSFSVFQNWAENNGYRVGLDLDRIDGSRGYSPDNCRFVTAKENCRNRDVTHTVMYCGTRVPLTEILETKGLSLHYGAIRSRLKRGWRAQKAIDVPIREGNYHRKPAPTGEP